MGNVLYRVVKDKRVNGNGKYYGRAVQLNTVNLSSLSDIIQRNCSMKKSDVLAVLTELVEVMQDQLQNSMTVKLDGFGAFKIGIKSKPADSEEEFTASSNIAGARVNFLPEGHKDSSSNKITRQFLNGVTFQKYEV